MNLLHTKLNKYLLRSYKCTFMSQKFEYNWNIVKKGICYVHNYVLDFYFNLCLSDNFSNCESCTEDLHCGFCYIEQSTYTAINGSCLPYSDDSQSSVGRCNGTSLPDKLAWANNYCPSPYSIMGLIGLILYLMAFAPGNMRVKLSHLM